MKPKVIIFGLGTTCKFFFDHYNNEYEIIGLSDWDESKHGTKLFGYPIISPYEFQYLDYDYILIMSAAVNAIASQLEQRCGIEKSQLRIFDKYYFRVSQWSIGILHSDSTFNITEEESNPLLAYSNEKHSNLKPVSVADPFIYEENGKKYLFYEVLCHDEENEDLGIINLAVIKEDGSIEAKGTILELDTSISFPIIYKENNEYYMTIHSKYANEIMLFIANDFPMKWRKLKILAVGRYCDPVIMKKENLFYLMASLNNEESHLFYADQIEGPYNEHPKNPVIKKNPRIARNAGMPFEINKVLYRPTQDCEKGYGRQIRLMEIQEMNPQNFVEQESEYSPVLQPDKNVDWRNYRMHTFNIFDLDTDGNFKIITDGDTLKIEKSVLKTLPNKEVIEIKTLK